jgi:MarR family transcriptional regulator, organic hydroperoxide resistance regulator
VSPHPFPLEPALDFLQHLWALNHLLERNSLLLEKRLGVTAQQRLILRCLGKYPGMTASQLAAVLHLDRGTISVSLRRLMKKRLVVGKRNRHDRRRVALTLTAGGRRLDRPAVGSVEHAVEQLSRKVGQAPMNRTKRLLRQLSDELEKNLAG